MRYVAFLLCLALLIGCGSPRREITEEEKRAQEELEAQDQGTEHRDPDGAFGAKDFANEAREMSDRNTQVLESAAEEKQMEQE